MNLNTEDLEMVGRAVGKAVETYNREINKDGTDPSYCPISITVHELTRDFQEIGQIIFKEMDFQRGRKEDGI